MVPSRLTLLFYALLSALSLGGYLLYSQGVYAIGFPLDDAWIHQTYARSLAQNGEWAFQPGERSGGSTAPLWSGLLGLGHLLGLEPYGFAFFLGWLCLWGLAVSGFQAFVRLRAGLPALWAAGAGALLALEWHLVWAAGSGMETSLFALFALALLSWLVRLWNTRAAGAGGDPGLSWLGVGGLVGLSVWVRPDGMTLLGPALLVGVMVGGEWRGSLRIAKLAVIGFAALFLPYLLFNYSVAGAYWPTTLYAKQAEYAVLLSTPLPDRILRQVVVPLIGAGVLLLPGFLYGLWGHLRRGEWGAAAGALWVMCYLGSYALRLPVTYQHGRYAIPVIPVFCVWGLAGLAGLLRIDHHKLWWRVTSRAWLASAGAILLVFWGRGALAYAQDVAVIESEMAVVARWVAENTQPGDLIAAHDIGALGYFGARPLLDLAGLVSPEVIPFIRDEEALEAYLDGQGASYLVTFPGWYPALSARGSPVFATGGRFSPGMGGENMVVYDWNSPSP
jgi:hypothetical protein